MEARPRPVMPPDGRTLPARYCAIFPNLLLTLHPDYIWIW